VQRDRPFLGWCKSEFAPLAGPNQLSPLQFFKSTPEAFPLETEYILPAIVHEVGVYREDPIP